MSVDALVTIGSLIVLSLLEASSSSSSSKQKKIVPVKARPKIVLIPPEFETKEEHESLLVPPLRSLSLRSSSIFSTYFDDDKLFTVKFKMKPVLHTPDHNNDNDNDNDNDDDDNDNDNDNAVAANEKGLVAEHSFDTDFTGSIWLPRSRYLNNNSSNGYNNLYGSASVRLNEISAKTGKPNHNFAQLTVTAANDIANRRRDSVRTYGQQHLSLSSPAHAHAHAHASAVVQGAMKLKMNDRISFFTEVPIIQGNNHNHCANNSTAGFRFDDAGTSFGASINPLSVSSHLFSPSSSLSSSSSSSSSSLSTSSFGRGCIENPHPAGLVWLSGVRGLVSGGIELDIASSSSSSSSSPASSLSSFFPLSIRDLRAAVYLTPASRKSNNSASPSSSSSSTTTTTTPSTSPSSSFTLGVTYSPITSRLLFSYFHSLVVRRRVKNPFESEDVVGINNYINFAFQVQAQGQGQGQAQAQAQAPGQQLGQRERQYGEGESDDGYEGGEVCRSAEDSVLRAAASWQINKNALIKGRLSGSVCSLCLALKSWWEPNATFSLAVNHQLNTNRNEVSVNLTVSNISSLIFNDTAPTYRRQVSYYEKDVTKTVKETQNY